MLWYLLRNWWFLPWYSLGGSSLLWPNIHDSFRTFKISWMGMWRMCRRLILRENAQSVLRYSISWPMLSWYLQRHVLLLWRSLLLWGLLRWIWVLLSISFLLPLPWWWSRSVLQLRWRSFRRVLHFQSHMQRDLHDFWLHYWWRIMWSCQALHLALRMSLDSLPAWEQCYRKSHWWKCGTRLAFTTLLCVLWHWSNLIISWDWWRSFN